MKRPIIGISTNMMIAEETDLYEAYEDRTYVTDNFIKSVLRAGGVPVAVPMTDDTEAIKRQVELLDGLIMTGGEDVDPQLYGEEPSDRIGGIFHRRDDFDVKLIKAAVEKKIPILGVCRGYQMINVVFGGTLYQDLSFIEGKKIKHIQRSKLAYPIHMIDVEKGTVLGDIIGDSMRVNSLHHLAVKDTGKGFRVNAKSRDGIIEGIEYTGDQYILGVQFHPEMMSEINEKAQRIFDDLVRAAKENNNR